MFRPRKNLLRLQQQLGSLEKKCQGLRPLNCLCTSTDGRIEDDEILSSCVASRQLIQLIQLGMVGKTRNKLWTMSCPAKRRSCDMICEHVVDVMSQDHFFLSNFLVVHKDSVQYITVRVVLFFHITIGFLVISASCWIIRHSFLLEMLRHGE